MSLTKDTVKGFSWLAGFRGFARSLTFLRTAILARILLPDQFGVYGIAVLSLAFLEIITETGVNVFLVQEDQDVKEHLNTAWIVSVFSGGLIALLIVLTTPLIVNFFNSPASGPLLYLIGLVALIRGFINPARVKFQKQLEFNKDFWFRSSIFLAETVTAVVLALITKSAAALVVALIVSAVLEVVFSFAFIKPWPRLKFRLPQFKAIVSQGKWLTLAGVFNYLASQGDDAVVAKLLNTTSLGFYQMAFKLATLPVTEIGDVVGNVTFPVYVKIAGDRHRLKKAYLKTLASVILLTVPLGFILFSYPGEIITIAFGSNWLPAAPALKVLALYGVVRAISGSGSALFLSLKKQKIVTVTTFVRLTALALFIIPLTLKQGIVGAAQASLLSSLVAFPVVFFFVFRVLTHNPK